MQTSPARDICKIQMRAAAQGEHLIPNLPRATQRSFLRIGSQSFLPREKNNGNL